MSCGFSGISSHARKLLSSYPAKLEGKKKNATKAFIHPFPLLLRVDGARIASSTGIDILLLDDFNLVINDTTHLVRPPRRGESTGVHSELVFEIYVTRLCAYTVLFVRVCVSELLAHEEAERLNDVKLLVQQLYTTLRIEEHQISKERELIGRLEDLNSQLRPLEKVTCVCEDCYKATAF